MSSAAASQSSSAQSTAVPSSSTEAVDVLAAQRAIVARMERMPLTPTQHKARLVMGMATFFDGYDSIMLGLVMPVLIAQWHLTVQQTGFLLSGTFVGQLLGAILFPYLAERIGRLRAASYSVWLVGLLSLVCAGAWNFMSLALVRIVQGVGLGGEVPVAATYMNEIARAKGRGRFFLLYEVAFGVGIVASTLIGLLLIPNFGWRSMFLVGAVPALIAAFMRRAIPESPRWLASKGRIVEADQVVSAMEREAEAKTGQPLPAVDINGTPLPVKQKTSFWELFSDHYRLRTLVLWSIWALCFFVTTAINSWLPSIYSKMGLELRHSLAYTLAGFTITIAGSMAVALLIDKTGRRPWIGGALFFGSLPMLVLAWLGATSPYQVLVCASLTHLCFATVSISIYVYTTELYPTRMRALGTGMGSVMRNIFAALSPTMVAFMMNRYGLPGVFAMLGTVPMLAVFMVLVFGTETKGRVLEELSP